jgi:hypothetical protein
MEFDSSTRTVGTRGNSERRNDYGAAIGLRGKRRDGHHLRRRFRGRGQECDPDNPASQLAPTLPTGPKISPSPNEISWTSAQ